MTCRDCYIEPGSPGYKSGVLITDPRSWPKEDKKRFGDTLNRSDIRGHVHDHSIHFETSFGIKNLACLAVSVMKHLEQSIAKTFISENYYIKRIQESFNTSNFYSNFKRR